MADETPTRYLQEDQLDGDQTLAVIQARRRGDPVPQFESTAYRKHRADVLREGGLDEEADETEQAGPVALEDMNPSEHLRRIQGAR